jgi:hypothetical protein
MAVIKLGAGQTTTLPPSGTLGLTWQVTGLHASQVQLRFERTDSPGQPAPAAQATGPNSWLVPALPVAATVIVRPAAGGTFPDGVRIDQQLSLRLGASGSDEFVLPSVDVSGTSQSSLLELVPLAGVWQLTVAGARVPARTAPRGEVTAPSPDLPELTQSAIYRSRELAGPDGVLPEHLHTELQIAIDGSASMLPFVRSGARRSLLEVLVGVNAVAGTSAEMRVWQLGTSPEPSPRGLSNETVQTYDALLGSVPRTTGTVLAPLVQATANGTRRTVIVLSDGVPADLDDLQDALGAARGSGSQTRWHLLAFARSTADPAVRLEPWRDELTSLRRLLGDSLTASSVSPGDGEGWLAQRLADTSQVMALVAGLGLVGGSTT